MRSRSRFAGREFWRVRIMAGNTIDARDRSHVAVPVAASAPVGAGFPITISGSVTTATERRAVRQLQMTTVARLKLLQVGLIVTIETKAVPVVASMSHHDLRM